MLESGQEESMQSFLEVVILRGGGFEILTSTSGPLYTARPRRARTRASQWECVVPITFQSL